MATFRGVITEIAKFAYQPVHISSDKWAGSTMMYDHTSVSNKLTQNEINQESLRCTISSILYIVVKH